MFMLIKNNTVLQEQIKTISYLNNILYKIGKQSSDGWIIEAGLTMILYKKKKKNIHTKNIKKSNKWIISMTQPMKRLRLLISFK